MTNETTTKIALFKGRGIRRTLHNNEGGVQFVPPLMLDIAPKIQAVFLN